MKNRGKELSSVRGLGMMLVERLVHLEVCESLSHTPSFLRDHLGPWLSYIPSRISSRLPTSDLL